MDEVDIEIAEEELADEGGFFPLRLAGGLGNLHRFHGALGFHFSHQQTPDPRSATSSPIMNECSFSCQRVD